MEESSCSPQHLLDIGPTLYRAKKDGEFTKAIITAKGLAMIPEYEAAQARSLADLGRQIAELNAQDLRRGR
jgi:hypothetical protein